jgi:hypothetical protein
VFNVVGRNRATRWRERATIRAARLKTAPARTIGHHNAFI